MVMPPVAPRLAATACLALLATTTTGSLVPVPAAAQAAQATPSTDIYLAGLDLSVDPPVIGTPRNLTDRDGYDNQPAFSADGISLLYTSNRAGQTDILRLDLATLQVSAVTSTAESEYSPLPIPGRDAIAVVRVEADGTQRLWLFAADGSDPDVLFADLAPVGYHAWNRDGAVAMFVLGEPASLWLGDANGDTAPRQVAADIGRSLQPIPGTAAFSFLQRIDGEWQVRRLHADGSSEPLGAPLAGSQDLAWCPDGRWLMGRGSEIWVRGGDGGWRRAADLAASGIADITRLAVSPDGTRLAFVAGR